MITIYQQKIIILIENHDVLRYPIYICTTNYLSLYVQPKENIYFDIIYGKKKFNFFFAANSQSKLFSNSKLLPYYQFLYYQILCRWYPMMTPNLLLILLNFFLYFLVDYQRELPKTKLKKLCYKFCAYKCDTLQLSRDSQTFFFYSVSRLQKNIQTNIQKIRTASLIEEPKFSSNDQRDGVYYCLLYQPKNKQAKIQ